MKKKLMCFFLSFSFFFVSVFKTDLQAQPPPNTIIITPLSGYLKELVEFDMHKPYRKIFSVPSERSSITIRVDIGPVYSGDTRHVWMNQIRRTIGSFLDEVQAEEISVTPSNTPHPRCFISYENGDAWNITVGCNGDKTLVEYRDFEKIMLKKFKDGNPTEK